MPRTNREPRRWALVAACLAGAACGGTDQNEEDGAALGGGERMSGTPYEASDFGVFARADSARGGIGPGGVPAGADAQDRPAVGGDPQGRPAEGSGAGPAGETEPGTDSLAGPRLGLDADGGAAPDSVVPDAEAFPPAPAVVAAGTRVRVRLDEGVSADMHLPGHAVVATVATDVTGPAGTLLIRAGAKLLGRVTAAEPSPGPGEDAHLELEFETLSADSFERPVRAVLAGGARGANPFGAFVEPRPYEGRLRAGATVLVEMRTAFSVPPQADSLPGAGGGAGDAG